MPLSGPTLETDLPDQAARAAAARGELAFLRESELWERLGLVDPRRHLHRLHTPAMLAELLGVSVAIIRRWHRRGLIVPAREVHRLPYFDFCEVATARRLAELLAAGCSPAAIERQLDQLRHYHPAVERPLAQLSVIVQGKRLLLRQGDGLIEPGGQYRFDFDAMEGLSEIASAELPGASETRGLSAGEIEALRQLDSPAALRAEAAELEDADRLSDAVEMYRAALALGGPDAETNFQLAELLYRQGDTAAARERYYVAIEIDEDFVEARANLGCVLAELGQYELAVAAFRGALAFHADYPDAHYHLARALDEMGDAVAALPHWRSFLELAPDSPWAEAARGRVEGQAASADP